MRMVFVPIRIRYLSVYRCNRLASSLQAKTGGEGIKLGAKTVLLAVLTLGIGAAASVQYGRGRVPRYDASTEVTVSGTVVSCAFLFLFGTTAVKGFAVTLVIGLVANVFTAVFVSKTIFYWELSGQKRAVTLSI